MVVLMFYSEQKIEKDSIYYDFILISNRLLKIFSNVVLLDVDIMWAQSYIHLLWHIYVMMKICLQLNKLFGSKCMIFSFLTHCVFLYKEAIGANFQTTLMGHHAKPFQG